MAEVKPGDRQSSGFADGKFPVSTAAQIRSAIKLRHNGKGHSAAQVLSHCSAAIASLLAAHKISSATATELRAMVAHARQADK